VKEGGILCALGPGSGLGVVLALLAGALTGEPRLARGSRRASRLAWSLYRIPHPARS